MHGEADYQCWYSRYIALIWEVFEKMQRIANIDGRRMWCHDDVGQQVDAASQMQVSR